MNQALTIIAKQFSASQNIIAISPLGNGLINDSYRVSTANTDFVLQRLNHQVFANPKQIMINLQRLSEHIKTYPLEKLRLQMPSIIQTHDQQDYFIDQDKNFWRALTLIQPAESREQIKRPTEAEQVGFALGHFHSLCSTLSTDDLFDTLPGFHITPHYYLYYQSLKAKPLSDDNQAELDYCQQFINQFQPHIAILEQAKQQNILRKRVIHGDPKLNNFLFQPDSDKIISLIDLDTVKPGLVHYDIGDCIRSCCNNNNQFDLDRAEIILLAYLQEAQAFFTEHDYRFLFPAIQLIPFELGLRFFSDYLAGNVYFKVKDKEQNLRRACNLFHFTNDISLQKPAIEKMLKGIQAKIQ